MNTPTTPGPAMAPTTGLHFSAALAALKEGKHIKRAGWGGYWYLAKKAELRDDPNNDKYIRACVFNEIIVAVLAGGGVAPAQPYQPDLLANDWEVFER